MLMGNQWLTMRESKSTLVDTHIYLLASTHQTNKKWSHMLQFFSPISVPNPGVYVPLLVVKLDLNLGLKLWHDLYIWTFILDRSIERSLGEFVDEKKAKLLKDKSLPVVGCAMVAGRTDKGVTALGQVCSFCMFYNSFSSKFSYVSILLNSSQFLSDFLSNVFIFSFL